MRTRDVTFRRECLLSTRRGSIILDVNRVIRNGLLAFSRRRVSNLTVTARTSILLIANASSILAAHCRRHSDGLWRLAPGPDRP